MEQDKPPINPALPAVINVTSESQKQVVDFGFQKGILHFGSEVVYGEKDMPCLYVKVPKDANASDVATYMLKDLEMRMPNIILSIITSTSHYKLWKYQDQVKDFQDGLIQAANTTEMWIFTQGFNSGISRIIGEAIRKEKHRRYMMEFTTSESLPKLTVIGMLRIPLLQYSSTIDNATAQINIKNKGRRQELNPDHSHHIMLKGDSDTRDLYNMRIKFEEFCRNISRRSSSIHGGGDTSARTNVPMVGLLIQGGPFEVEHVAELLLKKVPVIVMKGTGLAADLVAFAYLEHKKRYHEEYIDSYLKEELMSRIKKCFPRDFKEGSLTREGCRDKILECVYRAHQDDQKFLTILETDGASPDLKNLDKYILLALLESQAMRKGIDFKEQIKSDLKLTLDWNRCDLALSQIFQKNDWTRIKIDDEMFDRALLKEGGEDFVDLFLHRDAIKVNKYLSYEKIIFLFNNLKRKDFFVTVCLEEVLSKTVSPDCPLEEGFDLDYLLFRVTRLKLSMKVVRTNKTNWHETEGQAINALVLWAALTFNPKLTKVFLKRTENPMVLALIVSMMWNNLARKWCRDLDTKQKVKASAVEFGKMAVNLLDMAYSESGSSVINSLDKKLPDFENRTAIEIAHIARNKLFMAHPVCQKWLYRRWNENIQMRELHFGPFKIAEWLIRFGDDETLFLGCKFSIFSEIVVEIYLSVLFIIPMFYWITYKSYKSTKEPLSFENFDKGDVVNDGDGINLLTPRKKESNLKCQCGEQKQTIPPYRQLYYLWNAPVTKFWISQLFYILYLTLFSLAVVFPSCGNMYMDLAVFGWTFFIWLEVIRVARKKRQKYLEINLFWTTIDILLIAIFLVTVCFFRIVPHFASFVDYKTSKFVMSIGLLYFYYRTLSVFLPISPVLGPMLISIRKMIERDFLTWMRMFLIIMISGGVTIQAVLYPNYPFTSSGIRKSFTRAFFAIFLTQVDDLEGDDTCSHVYSNSSLNNCGDKTIRDDLTLNTCPYSSAGGYFIVMQYLIITKLVMITLLYALFSATNAKVTSKSERIWKFQKYSLIMNFQERLILPPPLNVFCYLYMAAASLCACIPCCKGPRFRNHKWGNSSLNETKEKRRGDHINWRKFIEALMELEKQEQTDSERLSAQIKTISVLTNHVEKQNCFNDKVTGQMAHLENNITTCTFLLENIKDILEKQQVTTRKSSGST